MLPDLVRRSQRGDAGETAPGSPAVSPVKSYCIRTPWAAVTSIAAYAEPGVVPALIRIPALDQGCRPAVPRPPALLAGPAWPAWPAVPAVPVSDVTRTVMVPLPRS